MKKNIYFLLPAAAFVLTGCSKMGKFTSDNFTVTPTPLEYVAGEVPATISAKIPAKFMPKKAVVTCTPVLKWNGGSQVGASATFQGEKVEANNTIVSYKNGGNVTMRTAYAYQPGMENSELWMTFNARKGSKTVKVPDVKIGNGTICTPALVMETAKSGNFSVAQDNFQRVINQKQAANIKFLINQANLRGSELNSQNIKDFIATLRNIKNDEQSLVLNNINIESYASPDGKYSFNEALAERRGATSENYVRQQLKAQKLKTNVDTKYTAEDWEGFQELVSQSNLQDKELILRVLSMYQDPEQREREIQNIATVYSDLATAVLPELRRSRMVINYDVIGRSDEEIMEQFSADATKLSVEELLYAANILSNNNSQALNILNKTVEIYPNDFRAYNDIATLAMSEGNYDKAKSQLQKALSVNSSAAEPNVNLGILSLINGNISEAETLISKGASGYNADEALGELYIAQGKYALAATKLSKSSTNSAALANIMVQDYASATTVLNAIKNPNGMTYYLKAILASRMGDKNAIASNLREAITRDPSLATKAANDLEFSKYSSVISSLVK